jgi:integrase/recombinase XerD
MKSGTPENVFFQYDNAIQQYTENKQIGTASNYDLSQKAIKNFIKDTSGYVPDVLLFREITPKWLTSFENYMANEGKSQTTTGIYLRPLRALFNSAISEGIITQSIYPFGRRKYEIPQPKSVKKALTRNQLKQLFEAEPATPEQERAKDYFFFIFNTAGMNVKDIAQLKYENLKGETFIYIREKTKRTSKGDLKPVVVYLNEYALNFIDKYGNPDRQLQNYVFDIYKPGMTELEKYKRSNNFTRFLNQHLKKLAKANGLPEEISVYWARHSFATNAIRGGASLEQISQALNHHDLSTTKGYFAGFEDDAMRALTDNLMNFD